MTNINKSSKKRATSFELKKDPTKMHDLLMNKSVLKMEIQFSMYDLFNNEKEKGFQGFKIHRIIIRQVQLLFISL